MSPTKVMLSTKELELVSNTDWILTKNNIIQKVYTLFGLVSSEYQTIIQSYPLINSQEIMASSPKIAKGEQYEGLPWVMLDFPRCYDAINWMGVRSFFWWGNSFCITLLLGGSFRAQYESNIIKNVQEKKISQNWLIGIGDNPWQHHFRENNYLPIQQFTIDQIKQLPFLKLTKKLNAADWSTLPAQFEEGFKEIGQLLH